MKRSYGTAAWLMVLAVSVAPAAAAQIEPGRIYTGREQISDPGTGLTLTIPAGWRGRLSPDGESFLLESEVGGGYIVVVADALTEAQARQQMAEPLDLGDGIVLTLAGQVRDVASGHLSASYSVRGPASEFVGTVDVRVTQAGLGVAFILLSPPAAAEAQQEAMREFAFSLGVQEQNQPVPGAGQAAGNDEWEPYLRGRYLARYFTRTGYTESTELWLCSNGEFYYDSQGGGFGGGASGAVQSRGQGRWSATGAGRAGTLLLTWSSGERTSLELSYDYEDDRLYVNGDRMLRGNNERCQ
jgi:hypothetical protein